MTELINEIISTILQLVVFSAAPYLFYYFGTNRTSSFWNYIGLYKPSGNSIGYILASAFLFLMAGMGVIFMDEDIQQTLLHPPSVTGKLKAMGVNPITLLVLLIIALFKTSLSEEIFFRGFLARQFTQRFGFRNGNILQASLFGLVHLILFYFMAKTTTFFLVFIFLFSYSAAWTIGYLKEKYANGSIVPGWMAHGLGNTISYLIILLYL
ncbi:MAG: CPBP family intramembrane metalloprotease [Saprospiraceae bacterium]|nr:CPBP family intramembrane metalloprotease [Saprospiraceae bacterium]